MVLVVAHFHSTLALPHESKVGNGLHGPCLPLCLVLAMSPPSAGPRFRMRYIMSLWLCLEQHLCCHVLEVAIE